MSDPERIERLEARVDRIEDHLGTEVATILAKIDALGAVINNHLIAAAKSSANLCPSPGSCLLLAKDLQHTIAAHDLTMRRVIELENRILIIEKWQGRVLGGIAVLMVVLTLFGENIRNLFRIP
jgi:hypothetical protein